MTSYAKKLPVAVGIFFFSLACSIALFSGTEIATALIRGAVAGVVATLMAAMLGYILFAEKLPEAELPPELAQIARNPEQEE